MDKAELLKLIENAFKKVALGDGIGLYEAIALDDYASDKKIAKARKKDRELWKKWTEIPFDVIESFSSALCFVDKEGMRFLLPAFMSFAVEKYGESASMSVDSPIYTLDRGFSIFDGKDDFLNKEQKNAIAQFLKFMERTAGDDYVDAQFASNAYIKYWGRYDLQA